MTLLRALPLCLLPLCLLPAMAHSAALDLPAAGERVALDEERLGSLRLPITGWDVSGLQSLWAEGAIRHEAWQLEAGLMTTLELLAPMRNQLVAAGYDILFECEAKGCGGFDFRYALEVLPEPEMHVDLGDYRYLAASRSAGGSSEYVALLVSRAAGRGFVQITRVDPTDTPEITARPAQVEVSLPDVVADGGILVRSMIETGGAVLEDLTFAKGSADLAANSFASLAALAEFLSANPQAEIVLVGHTDAEGTLQGNIALSKARATAVRSRLAEQYGIAEARVRAEGVGYLAPMASNLTEQGRTQNRRVEVILKTPG